MNVPKAYELTLIPALFSFRTPSIPVTTSYKEETNAVK